MLKETIEKIMSRVEDPYLKISLKEAGVLKHWSESGTFIELDLQFPYPVLGARQTMTDALKNQFELENIKQKLIINYQLSVDTHNHNRIVPALKNIKNIIAVASGKGGVGKSLVAINLALALSKEGAKVGLLDADIYGPSQPSLLGAAGQKPKVENGLLFPVEICGIQSMSIGYLVNQTAPMVWRGPMIGKAMQQMLFDTQWDQVDYLIVDLPPGTGDIQLTLSQKIPLSGAVVVTTPQDLALIDVKRAIEMFLKLNIPILGLIENMSTYHCPECGHTDLLFGEGGGMRLSQAYQVPLLSQIPLDKRLRELTDAAQLSILNSELPFFSNMMIDMARQLGAALALQPKDYSSKFPKIVTDNK